MDIHSCLSLRSRTLAEMPFGVQKGAFRRTAARAAGVTSVESLNPKSRSIEI